jgi:hypothetical protein
LGPIVLEHWEVIIVAFFLALHPIKLSAEQLATFYSAPLAVDGDQVHNQVLII